MRQIDRDIDRQIDKQIDRQQVRLKLIFDLRQKRRKLTIQRKISIHYVRYDNVCMFVRNVEEEEQEREKEREREKKREKKERENMI